MVLRFSVRFLTNHQKCRDLSAHIRRLEHKVECLQRVRKCSCNYCTKTLYVYTGSQEMWSLLITFQELKTTKENTQPLPSDSSSSVPVPAQREDVPTNYPNSPSRQRSRHQHSHSEPIPPSPRERDGRHDPHEREERHNLREHDRRQERDLKHEQERRHSQERRQEQVRQYDQERRRQGVRRRDRDRGYREHDHRGHHHISMSQQSMRTHSQQIPGGSPMKGGCMSQQRHSDSRLVGIEPAQQISYHSQRRDSGEGLWSHRRLSADPALLQHHFETPISPPSTYRHHLAPPRGSTQPQEHLHFRHDSVGSGTDEVHFGEEFGSQVSLSASPARRISAERRPPRFEEVGGDDEGGCSQPRSWGELPISHNDIQISITDSLHHPTASTLTATSQPRPQHHSHLHLHHGQSQEPFVEDEETGRFMATDHMLGGPFSSQFPYFDHYEDGSHAPPPTSMPSHTSALSQPTVSKHRFQSSVPNLSIPTGTSVSNLNHSQRLSQSVLEMSRHSHHGEHMRGFRYADATIPRITVSSRPMSQSYHNHLNQMPSDSHLNTDGMHHPGLMRTMLARLKEEPEHSGSPASRRRRQRAMATALQPGSASNPTSQPNSSGSNSELTPTNAQPPNTIPSPPPPETSAPVAAATGSQFLGAGRSNSNTSLSNLDLIW